MPTINGNGNNNSFLIKAFLRLPTGKPFRIDWFGNVFYSHGVRHSQPFIDVTFSEVLVGNDGVYPEKFDSPIQQYHVSVPVGYLPQLRIGDIWQDGLLVQKPEHTLERFNLEVGQERTTIIKAGISREENADFVLPFDQHPYHKDHTNSYCLEAETKEGHVLIIPAIELIRFYFGSSSNLLARLFLAPFDEKRLWTTASKDERGIAHVGLSKGISGYSAADVARIALNSTAKKAARLVSDSCMVAFAMKEKAYPKAIFPFSGETNLEVSGVWIGPTEVGRKTFLVFRILSCAHPFPFTTLRYTMEKSPVTMKSSSQDSKSGCNDTEFRFRARKEPVKPLDDSEPSRNLSTRKLSVLGLVRFPDLEAKAILRTDPETPITVFCPGESPTVNSWSTGEGDAGFGIRPVDVVDATRAPDPASHPLFNTAYWDTLSKLVDFLKNKFPIVQYVPLDRRQRHPLFSVMPRIVNQDGEIHPWCLIEEHGKNRARYVSILRYGVDFPSGIVFFLETAHKDDSREGAQNTYMCFDPDGNSGGANWYYDKLHYALWGEGQSDWLTMFQSS